MPFPQKKALIFDLIPSECTDSERMHRAQEFENLLRTLGGIQIHDRIFFSGLPDYQLFISPQTVENILRKYDFYQIDFLILNNIVKPRQIFTLSEIFAPYATQVWDRMDLILKIFSLHAESAEAKLQVELAKIRHMGPRIYGMGTQLSRQGGGIGTSGIGETNTEIMKRHLRAAEHRISQKLKQLEKTKDLQRGRRARQNFYTVSAVGYTNAGKSSVMKALTRKQNVEIANALFTTLDTRIGKLFLPSVFKNVLVSDTIGFIADLPPELIAAFTSTLSETIHSDLLLHIVDISDDEWERKIVIVDDIIKGLQIETKPQILVLNKIDRLPKYEDISECMNRYADRTPVSVSALQKTNFDLLKAKIAEVIYPRETNVYKKRFASLIMNNT
ncbi:GTPase HflX [Candidatus Peregrinibacteria bacterium]|nr:GTPase HflX [Candidatus Peregrinibacteria bacterium]